jgi:hypothetical protein
VSELILLLVVGGLLLAALVALLLRGVPQAEPAPASFASIAQMVALPGLTFARPERFFDDSDYQRLRHAPRMATVAEELRAERRRLALLWLRLLHHDLRALWRFRRLLARHGVTSGPGEELQVAFDGLLASALLATLRSGVYLLGPFAVARISQAARHPVEAVWRSSAYLVGKLPASRLLEVERHWTASLAE